MVTSSQCSFMEGDLRGFLVRARGQFLWQSLDRSQDRESRLWAPICGLTSGQTGQGRFLDGAGLAVSLETSLAEAEGVGPAPTDGKFRDSLRCFPARHGLGIAWALAQ
jgi:hypothetical protein